MENKIESHSERDIYDGCLKLMDELIGHFRDYLEYMGHDVDSLDEEETFCVGISNMEIVRMLFLQHTTHSGGTSTIQKCKELGVDWSRSVKFSVRDDDG